MLLKEVWSEWRRQAEDWRGRTIRFIVQSAFLFLILFELPVLGSVHDATHLALAGACSVIGSAFLLLVWSAAAAPFRVHTRVMSLLREQHFVIAGLSQDEKASRVLYSIFEEGMDKYKTIKAPEVYIDVMNKWSSKMEDYVRKNFPTSEYYKIRASRHRTGATFMVPDAGAPWTERTKSTRESCYGQLKALEELIEFPPSMIDQDLCLALYKRGKSILDRH